MTDLGGLGGEEGNSHSSSPLAKNGQVPKRKNHFFTIFNYSDKTIGGLLEYFNKHATKYRFQEEICPETQKEHLQGMVMFPTETRDTQFYKEKSGRFFPLKKDDGAYQGKDESRKPNGGRWEKGFPKPVHIISELYSWQKDIETIFLKEPDQRSVYWFWENKGGIGKSAFVKYMVIKHKCLFCDGGKKGDLINLVFNNDMDESKCVIWDLPRSTKGHISYSTIESIKNGLVCNTKYETGVKAFNSPHIFVFANYPPERPEELSEDRWVIKELI